MSCLTIKGNHVIQIFCACCSSVRTESPCTNFSLIYTLIFGRLFHHIVFLCTALFLSQSRSEFILGSLVISANILLFFFKQYFITFLTSPSQKALFRQHNNIITFCLHKKLPAASHTL